MTTQAIQATTSGSALDSDSAVATPMSSSRVGQTCTMPLSSNIPPYISGTTVPSERPIGSCRASGGNASIRSLTASAPRSTGAAHSAPTATVATSTDHWARSVVRPSRVHNNASQSTSTVSPTESPALGCTVTTPAQASPRPSAVPHALGRTTRMAATTPGTSTSAQAFGSRPLSLASCAPGRYSPAAITEATPAPNAIQPASARSQRTATAPSAAALVVHAAPANMAAAAFIPTTGSENTAPTVAASRWNPSG